MRRFGVGLLSMALISGAASVDAATISGAGTQTIANGATAPGVATDYTFFGGTGQPTFLTNFAVTQTASNQCCGNGFNYSSIVPPGGSAAFTTGIEYDSTGGAMGPLSDFQLISQSGDFTVYVLNNNTDGIDVGNDAISMSVNGGPAVSVTESSAGQPKNEFAVFNVTGAVPSDIFHITATPSANVSHPSIGGITFSAVTPEPATLGLLGLGGLALVARRRRA